MKCLKTVLNAKNQFQDVVEDDSFILLFFRENVVDSDDWEPIGRATLYSLYLAPT